MRKNVGHQNTFSVPDKPETVMRTAVKRQYGANDEKRKTFIDSIITKNGGLDADKVKIQQPIKKARNHGTLGTIFPEKREKPVDSVHSKTLNPKISALVDAIVNEEPISKDPDDSKTSKDPDDCSDDNDSGIEPMDMTAKDMKFEDDDEDEDDDDDDDSDDDDNDSRIEPIDMTAKDDKDEDDEDSERLWN